MPEISRLQDPPPLPPPQRVPPSDSPPPPAAPDTKPSPMTTPRLSCMVLFNDACIHHAYTRDNNIAGIVERPQRITSLKKGVAAAWSRLEQESLVSRDGYNGDYAKNKWTSPPLPPPPQPPTSSSSSESELESMMARLGLSSESSAAPADNTQQSALEAKQVIGGPFDILFTSAELPVEDPALNFIHPLPNLPPRSPPATSDDDSKPVQPPPSWPNQLQKLCRDSSTAMKTAPDFSEIPQHLPQGDLYLSPGSEAAIFGALGTVCEAVDRVVESVKSGKGYDRAFVAVRPPGHHCCEAAPMGFCFVNNVAVAAAHAHQKHEIDRIVILDIDLHHGNGTQDIVWRINAAADAEIKRNVAAASHSTTPRKSPSKSSTKQPPSLPPPRQLQVHYASLHDIFSYPCEDGDPAMVQAASLNLSGGHSQYISNAHLESWSSEPFFHEHLYPVYERALFGSATAFVEKTSPDPNKTLLLISSGFDASEHESAGMSRHKRNVPTSFFTRFASDARKWAASHSAGKVIAVLEGGYSERAIASGSMALLLGLAGDVFREVAASWYEEKNLGRLERACRTTGGVGRFSTQEPWLARTVEIFNRLEGVQPSPSQPSSNQASPLKDDGVGGYRRQLRERKPRTTNTDFFYSTTPTASPAKERTRAKSPARSRAPPPSSSSPPPQLPQLPQFPPPPPVPFNVDPSLLAIHKRVFPQSGNGVPPAPAPPPLQQLSAPSSHTSSEPVPVPVPSSLFRAPSPVFPNLSSLPPLPPSPTQSLSSYPSPSSTSTSTTGNVSSPEYVSAATSPEESSSYLPSHSQSSSSVPVDRNDNLVTTLEQQPQQQGAFVSEQLHSGPSSGHPSVRFTWRMGGI